MGIGTRREIGKNYIRIKDVIKGIDTMLVRESLQAGKIIALEKRITGLEDVRGAWPWNKEKVPKPVNLKNNIVTLLVSDINKDSNMENVIHELSENIYSLAVLYFEGVEGANKAFGNGHHAAQSLAEHAKKMLQDRVKQMEDIKK